MSREARARCAVMVDGFEADPFFVEIANAVNAYDGAERAVIAFAKTEEALYQHVVGLTVPDRRPGVDRRRGTTPNIRDVDVRRTSWYDRFFKSFRYGSPAELLAAVDSMEIDVNSL